MTPKQGNGDMPGLVNWRAGLDIQPDAAVLHPEQPPKPPFRAGDIVHIALRVVDPQWVGKPSHHFTGVPARLAEPADCVPMACHYDDVVKVEPRSLQPGDIVRVVNAAAGVGNYEIVAIRKAWAWCVLCRNPEYGGDLFGLNRLERVA